MKIPPDVFESLRQIGNAIALMAALAAIAWGVVSCQTVLEHRAQATCIAP